MRQTIHHTTPIGKRLRSKTRTNSKHPNKTTSGTTEDTEKTIADSADNPNWTPQHNCPDKTVKCNNCLKIGDFAQVCRGKPNSNTKK